MLQAAIPFVIGLALPIPSVPPPGWTWALVLAVAGLWQYAAWRRTAFGRRWVRGTLWWLAVIGFALLWKSLHDERRQGHYIDALRGDAEAWAVDVTGPPVDLGRSIRLWASARAARVDGRWRPATGKLSLTLLADSSAPAPLQGDRLVVKVALRPIDRIPAPGGFDVRQWMAGRGVFHQGFAPREGWARIGHQGEGAGYFHYMREIVNDWLHRTGLPDRERALVKALVLGQRDELQSDQTEAFVRSGTIHVLAVSGTHVGIIYMALMWSLVWLANDRRGRLLRGAATLLVLWGYAGLTGFAPSVLRATVMFTLFTLAQMTRWRVDSLNSLAAAAVLLLLWDPSMLAQLSFQLSFLAVLGIILFYDVIHRQWAAPDRLTGHLWSVFAVSVAAQAFTAPLCLYVFQAFPAWFLPANLAIAGLITLLVPGGVLLVLVHAVPVLGPMVAWVMKWLLMLLGFLTTFFGQLPGAYPALRVGFWGMLGLYALLACVAAWLLLHLKWARPAILCTIAALLAGWGWTAHRRSSQHGMAIYPQRDALTAAFMDGRTLQLFTSGTDRLPLRNVQDHVRSAGIQRIMIADSLPARITHRGRNFVFHAGGAQPAIADPGGSETVFVMHGNAKWDRRALDQVRGSEWVLAADLDGRVRQWLRREARDRGIPVFDMRAQGAYVRAE